MRVQKYTEVNGHRIPDFRQNFGGRLICEVDLYASIYGTVHMLDIHVPIVEVTFVDFIHPASPFY